MQGLARCFCASSLVFLIAVPAARADERSAEESFQAARRVYATSDYRGAALLFEQAYRAYPRGAAAYNAGLAWELAHEGARAADDYANALAVGDLPGAQASDAGGRLRRLETTLGRIDVDAEGGGLVSVAHVERVATPAHVHVAPGPYVVRVTWPDGTVTTREVTASAGSVASVAVAPNAVPLLASSPPQPTAPPPAEAPPPVASSPRTWVYASAGVALAGIVTGSVAGAMTLAAKSTVNTDCGIGGVRTACTPEGKSAADRGETTGLISTIGFSVGAAGLVAAAVLWFVRPKGSVQTGTLAPSVTANGRDVVIGASGSFP
jgi:hypothetical protein